MQRVQPTKAFTSTRCVSKSLHCLSAVPWGRVFKPVMAVNLPVNYPPPASLISYSKATQTVPGDGMQKKYFCLAVSQLTVKILLVRLTGWWRFTSGKMKLRAESHRKYREKLVNNLSYE